MAAAKLSAPFIRPSFVIRSRMLDQRDLAPDQTLGVLYVADDHGLGQEISHLDPVHPGSLVRHAAAM
ncbi:MAG TPA: hypothetical protein VM695_06925 [Phycisphaerae bacterium]|nr:hypothetical protein [Phycisphaerae bacterium]